MTRHPGRVKMWKYRTMTCSSRAIGITGESLWCGVELLLIEDPRQWDDDICLFQGVNEG